MPVVLVARRGAVPVALRRVLDRVARPTLKAFVLAYLYVALPRIYTVVLRAVRHRKWDQLPSRLAQIVARACDRRKFPVFAASLVAGINILDPIFRPILKAKFLSTWLSTFVSACVAFPTFQKHALTYARFLSLDFTLLVASRALDTALSSTLSEILPPSLSNVGDGLLFVASSTLIMYAWFYHPHRLPPAYSRWITQAANMDGDILRVLKALHDGQVVYGKEGPDILHDYCKRYGEDPKKGNVAHAKPLECRTVHCFSYSNCEIHALWRFWRGIKFAAKLYGTINLVMLLVPKKNQQMKSRIARAVVATGRSSAFLGTFIALTWYGVCMGRTRLLPKLFPRVPATHWDRWWCVALGSFAAGFSGFVENQQRRKELALFVFPKALGTLVSKKPTSWNLLVERLVFALSTSVLVAYCRKDPSKVRGIFGKGLKQVIYKKT